MNMCLAHLRRHLVFGVSEARGLDHETDGAVHFHPSWGCCQKILSSTTGQCIKCNVILNCGLKICLGFVEVYRRVPALH